MAIRTTYRPGDFLRDCDRCGFTLYASETKQQWDGLIVCEPCFETRHPQDFVRGRADRQNVPLPRPVPAYSYLGPLSTTVTDDAPAGQSFLLLTSTTGMTAADTLQIMLSSGAPTRIAIATVTSAVRVDLSSALNGTVSAGAVVLDVSSQTTADIGP